MEEVDASAGFTSILAIKDEQETQTLRSAAKVAAGVMKDYFIEEMSTIVDEGKKITHSKLCDKVQAKLYDEKFLKSKPFAKLGADVSIKGLLPGRLADERISLIQHK